MLCAVADADDDNSLFLAGLAIDDDSEILELFGHEQTLATVAPQPPHRLRIIARLNEDGRIEHGVELSDGERVFPTRRHLTPDAPAGEWQTSSDVEVDETPIGRIRTRRLDDGRVELGFMDTAGGIVTPEIRYLSADMPSGVWLRSAQIEVHKRTRARISRPSGTGGPYRGREKRLQSWPRNMWRTFSETKASATSGWRK